MREIRVRMYRQGLGDCFLISFDDGARTAHMMIDCGVLTGTPNAVGKINDAVEDILDATGGRLDVLVVTHEHWDHVSGFVQAAAKLGSLTVEDIWLAWTEDSTHPIANELREHRSKAKRALQGASQKLKASVSVAARETEKLVEQLALFDGGFPAAGRQTTADAMKWVREHDKARISYLRPGGEAVTIGSIPGIRVYVLGPPENVKQIKKDLPSKRNPEVYRLAESTNLGLLAALDPTAANGAASGPFDSSFEIPTKTASQRAFFRSHYFGADPWRRIEDAWLGSSEGLALQLDSDTNNTSLVLAIEDIASERVLLFPGDAQVGNWLSWSDHAWTFTKPDGSTATRNIADILARTVLYKVGHHASHNATLDEKGLELMVSPDLVALIPVDAAKARSLEWEMPFDPLLRRLVEKTRGRVIRSDLGRPPTRPDAVPERAWLEFQERVTETALFVEYRLT